MISESTSKANWYISISTIIFFIILFCVIGERIVNNHLAISPDSLIYLDSALNIADGRGCVHSFILTGEVDNWDGKKFIPVGYWQPGYPYFLALILRIFGSGNGLWIELIQGFLLWLTYLLFVLFPIYDDKKESGILCVIMCLITFPFTYLYSWLWSEALSTIFIYAFLFWVVKGVKTKNLLNWFVAGLFSGFAFGIKYVLITLFLFSVGLLVTKFLFSMVKSKFSRYVGKEEVKYDRRKCFYALIFLTVGWGVLSGPLFLRNYYLTGSLLGYAREGSETGFIENFMYVINTLLYSWFDYKFIPLEIQPQVLLVIVLFIVMLIILGGRYEKIYRWTCKIETKVILMWTILYVSVVIIYASVFSIDVIGVRLLSPALLGLIILLGGFILEVFNLSKVLQFIFCGIGIFVFLSSYPYRSEDFPGLREIAQKERIKWICENTTSKDFILGDSTFDISIFCGVRRSICFVPGSKKNPPPDYEMLKWLLNKIEESNSNLYVVLRKALPLYEHFKYDWEKWFGEALTELIFSGKCRDLEMRDFNKGRDFLAFKVEDTSNSKELRSRH